MPRRLHLLHLLGILGFAVLGAAACGGGSSSPMTPSPAPTPTPVAAPTPEPTPAATPTPAPAPEPTPSGGSASILRSAQIRGANGHGATGTAEIVSQSGRFTLELRGDFRIDSGRNDVYLTDSPNGISGSDLNLGDMKALEGAQSYEMPNDGGRYRYVMLWCRPFRVPIGVGELR